MRIQPVTDDIAESLKMETPQGRADLPASSRAVRSTAATIKTGDVIVKFDGRDVVEMRDLPRVVAESPVGKAVDVVIIRDGKEMTVKVTLGRLEDGENLAEAREPDQTPQTEEGTDQAEPPAAAALPASDIVLGMKLAAARRGKPQDLRHFRGCRGRRRSPRSSRSRPRPNGGSRLAT